LLTILQKNVFAKKTRETLKDKRDDRWEKVLVDKTRGRKRWTPFAQLYMGKQRGPHRGGKFKKKDARRMREGGRAEVGNEKEGNVTVHLILKLIEMNGGVSTQEEISEEFRHPCCWKFGPLEQGFRC